MIKENLKSLFTEYWHYFALCAACRLEWFDKIYHGQNTLEKLVLNNSWNLKYTQILIKFLIHQNYLVTDSQNQLVLTEKGHMLRKENSEGLYYACLNWFEEHLEAWKHLDYTLQTGKSAFELLYQKSYFDYLNENPEKLTAYHQAMYQYAIEDYKQLPFIIDFSQYKSIIDVGGGYGAIIQNVKKVFPSVRCILFDLPSVVKNVYFDEVDIISGNFFDSIPVKADAILLARVIHDWNDEKSLIILKNVHQALNEKGHLYLIENCQDKITVDLSLLTLNMGIMCESYERTHDEYISLCQNAGFQWKESKKLNLLQTIIIFEKL